jgi:hypothetical protein
MKATLTTIALAISLSASAQGPRATPTTDQPINMHLAGEHIEKAGKQRNTALLVVAASGLLGGMIIAMDNDMAAPALGIMGVGAVFSIGLNVSSNKHEQKAGRILQNQ